MTGLILFVVALLFLFFGYSVAFTFAGVSVLVGVLALGSDLFSFMPYRIMGVMENTTLMANGNSYVRFYGDCAAKNRVG